ncbi:MAG: hypothetical protein IJN08_03370, partial [Clostridia bacterium]|nr:hypothetical protein [Clostridia bacterium]
GDSEVFIAKDWGHQRNYSEEVAAKVDKEIRRILEEQFQRAKEVLVAEREALDRVVKYLIEYERITGEEFEKIFLNQPVELKTYKEKKAELEKPDQEVLDAEQADLMRRQRLRLTTKTMASIIPAAYCPIFPRQIPTPRKRKTKQTRHGRGICPACFYGRKP